MKIMLLVALFSVQADPVFVPENFGFKEFYQFYKK